MPEQNKEKTLILSHLLLFLHHFHRSFIVVSMTHFSRGDEMKNKDRTVQREQFRLCVKNARRKETFNLIKCSENLPVSSPLAPFLEHLFRDK